jgi:hypothetical protein
MTQETHLVINWFDSCPNTFETLLEWKKIRESLGSENHHVDQCNKIPENLGEIEYFYHRKCFQNLNGKQAKTTIKVVVANFKEQQERHHKVP